MGCRKKFRFLNYAGHASQPVSPHTLSTQVVDYVERVQAGQQVGIAVYPAFFSVDCGPTCTTHPTRFVIPSFGLDFLE